MQRLERHAHASLEAWNHARLSAFARELSLTVGSELLNTALAKKILPTSELAPPEEAEAHVAVQLRVDEEERVWVGICVRGAAAGGSYAARQQEGCEGNGEKNGAGGESAGQGEDRGSTGESSAEAVVAAVCEELVEAACSAEEAAGSPGEAAPVLEPVCQSPVTGRRLMMACSCMHGLYSSRVLKHLHVCMTDR